MVLNVMCYFFLRHGVDELARCFPPIRFCFSELRKLW